MKKILRKFCLLILISVFISGISMSNPVISSAKVKLNKKNLTLTVSQTYKLKIKGTKKKPKWSSNKKSVATVSSKGVVKGKKVGKATIIAKIAGKKYTCKVKVKEKENNVAKPIIPSTSNSQSQSISQSTSQSQSTSAPNLQISDTDVVILKGESHTLSISLDSITVDNSNAKWSSSDTTVASIDKGVIYGLKAGFSDITVYYNGISSTCRVTVEEPYINNGNITVEKNKTVLLEVKGTTKEITWTVDNISIISIDKDGLVTGKKHGTAKVKASIGNQEFVFDITVQDPYVDELVLKLIITSSDLDNDKKELEKNKKYLENAKSELFRAQAITIKVWDGNQWVYSADKAAVARAQENVDYYTEVVKAYEIKIADETELIESYKRQIELLT